MSPAKACRRRRRLLTVSPSPTPPPARHAYLCPKSTGAETAVQGLMIRCPFCREAPLLVPSQVSTAKEVRSGLAKRDDRAPACCAGSRLGPRAAPGEHGPSQPPRPLATPPPLPPRPLAPRHAPAGRASAHAQSLPPARATPPPPASLRDTPSARCGSSPAFRSSGPLHRLSPLTGVPPPLPSSPIARPQHLGNSVHPPSSLGGTSW